MELIVAPEEERLSIKSFLAHRFGGLSQMYLRGRVYKGFCFVDGEVVVNWGKKLKAGQVVSIDVDLDAATARRAEEIPLEVLFEDEGMIVINKAAGMLVHPTMHVKTGTLANALTWHLKGARFWFPHRLDQETSGVLVVAKTEPALRLLTRAWTLGRVKKEYLALVEGIVSPDELVMDAPIGRDALMNPAWGVRDTGKAALSRMWVEARLGNRTLVKLEPVTGRTNQLRIHCAHFGHPIVGDPLYGRGGEALRLHARKLEFEWQSFYAEAAWRAALTIPAA
jgi:23S rRNA pseudouridine1911/1915/1917 synthase